MKKTAFNCMVLALIFAIPSVFLGITDWQQYYHSEELFPIKVKIVLTGFLFIFLAAATVMGIKNRKSFLLEPAVYLICAGLVAGLGYFGAQLVYAKTGAPAPAAVQAGGQLYANNCGGCHPGGGNVIMPNLPVVNSPQLESQGKFIKFNRKPALPNGSPGTMPAFSEDKLSDEDLKNIYKYITTELSKGMPGK